MRTLQLFFSFSILFFSQTVFSQQKEIYSRVKVYATEQQSKKLLEKGVTLDELGERTSSYFIGEFSSSDIKLMKEENLPIEYLITDLAADFKKRNAAVLGEAQAAATTAAVPPGFNYGSMGGYLTFAEMELELDSLKMMYPDLVTTKINIGNSLEGRPIWVVKISDNPDVDENEPEVFLNGLIHAREALSMSNLIYFMQYILANYQTNPELNCLINNREIYIAACINPDGYVYNQTTNPSGGGGWRKNRRNNGGGTFGVDLNRNFGYKWGYDNTGSSPLGSSDSYRGTGPFSEPETQVIRDFCISHQFANVVNHHSYANSFNTPWGYINQATPDNLHYTNWGLLATAVNGFRVGTSYQNLGYVLNGGANDWMYGEQTVKNKIFAAVVETGSSTDGFWPLQNRIIPLNEGNLHLNITTCWVAGDYFKPVVPSATAATGSTFALPVVVTNYGLEAGTIETVSFSTTDARVISTGMPLSLTGLAVDASLNGTVSLGFADNASAGIINGTLSVTTRNGCVLDFPVSFDYLGNCEVLPSGWTSSDIGTVGIPGSVCLATPTYTVRGSGTGLKTTSDQYQFVRTAINGNYTIITRLNSVGNTSTNAKAGIVITESTATGSKRVSLCIVPSSGKIEFQSRKTTGSKVTTTSTVNGTAPRWLKITRNGNTFSAYHSVNGTTWTLYTTASVTMNSAAFGGLAVTSGINTSTNTAVFDNVLVSAGIQAITQAVDAIAIKESEAFTVYPNPSNGNNVRVQFTSHSNATAQVQVTDISGKVVSSKLLRVHKGTNTIMLDNLDKLSPGVYGIRISNSTMDHKTRLVIVGNK